MSKSKIRIKRNRRIAMEIIILLFELFLRNILMRCGRYDIN